MPKSAMAAISRLVAIGRLMKISEMFTLPALARPAAARRAPTASAAARARRPPAALPLVSLFWTFVPCSRRSWPSVTTVSPGFSPFSITHVVVHVLARDGHGPLIDGGVRFHDEDELAVLAGLHGLLRHDGRVLDRREPQPDARELPRPQAAIGIRKRRFQFDRVGRRIDGVVDERQLAARRLRVGVLRRGDDRQLALASCAS